MRYNRIWGSPNDGIFFDYGGTTNFQFYGNVYYYSGGALITFKAGYTNGTAYIYNNVFENNGSFGDYSPGWLDFTGTLSGGAVENNVYENIQNDGTAPGANYNAYSTSAGKQDSGANSFTYTSGTQFVNEPDSGSPLAANFHLTPTGTTTFANGTSLSSPYNADPDGNVRGAGGSWTIGAYQTPGTTPAAPTNLTGVAR